MEYKREHIPVLEEALIIARKYTGFVGIHDLVESLEGLVQNIDHMLMEEPKEPRKDLIITIIHEGKKIHEKLILNFKDNAGISFNTVIGKVEMNIKEVQK